MKLTIHAGDVPIRWAKVIEHSRGVFTLEFHTPFDEAVACEFRHVWDSRQKMFLAVDVYAARRNEPSSVYLEISGGAPHSTRAGVSWLRGRLLHYSDKRHVQTVIALPDGLLDHREGIQAEAEANFRVDYLESTF